MESRARRSVHNIRTMIHQIVYLAKINILRRWTSVLDNNTIENYLDTEHTFYQRYFTSGGDCLKSTCHTIILSWL